MAKFEEVFEDTQVLFTNHTSQIDNLREVNIKILANNRLKEIGKVIKANDLVKHMTSEDIIILLNERIFEQLNTEQKEIVIEELLAQIYFDGERSKVTLVKQDIPSGFSLVMAKHGLENYINAKLLIKELFSQAGEEDAENE